MPSFIEHEMQYSANKWPPLAQNPALDDSRSCPQFPYTYTFPQSLCMLHVLPVSQLSPVYPGSQLQVSGVAHAPCTQPLHTGTQCVLVRSGAYPTQHTSTTLSRISVWNTIICDNSAGLAHLGVEQLFYPEDWGTDVSDTQHHTPEDASLINQRNENIIPHSYVIFKTLFNIISPSTSAFS